MLGVTARWWLLLIVLTLFAGVAFVYGQTERYTIARGTVRERSQQCSFTVGDTPDAPMIVFAPGAIACHRMRELVNRQMRVSLGPDTEAP